MRIDDRLLAIVDEFNSINNQILVSDPTIIENYLKDASNYKGSAFLLSRPNSIEEVKSLLDFSNKNSLSITIQGSRTGLNGGAVPNANLIINLEKYTSNFEELEIFFDCTYNCYCVEIKSGDKLNDLNKYLHNNKHQNQANFIFGPNPTESSASFGGMIACNSSGSRSFKYGSIREHILELDILLANKEIIKIKKGEKLKDSRITKFQEIYNLIIKSNFKDKVYHKKNSASYYLNKNIDIIDLFIGSEGTLGIILNAKVKLIPKIPKFRLIVFFENNKELFEFVAFIEKTKLEIAFQDKIQKFDLILIEYFDSNSLKLVEIQQLINYNIDNKIEALFLEFEIINLDLQLEYLNNLISLFTNLTHLTMVDSDFEYISSKDFFDIRHLLPLKLNDKISQMNSLKISSDAAVPQESFFEFYNYTMNLINESNFENYTFGHLGDCHLHFNLIVPQNKINDAKGIMKLICLKAIEYGGTVSAEHGIGKIKKDYLKLMYNPEEIQVFKDIKKILDANNILNNENIF